MSIYLRATVQHDRKPNPQIGKWLDHYEFYSSNLDVINPKKNPASKRAYLNSIKEVNRAEQELKNILH